MKRRMHSMLNIMSIFLLIPLLIVFEYLIYKDAYNDTLRIVGMIVLFLFVLGMFFLIVIKEKAFAYIIFLEDKFVVKGFLCKREEFKYSDYYAMISYYVHLFGQERAIILSPINERSVTKIYTTKRGNLLYANKHKIFYCMFDEEIVKFLNEKYS